MKSQFIIETNPIVRWPVTVSLPADGGQLAEFEFDATVRVCSEAEYNRLMPPQAESEDAQDDEIKRRTLEEVLAENAKILPRLILDWRGPSAGGEPIPIADLPSMLVGPYGRALSVALYQAVFQVRHGLPAKEQPGATEGNSAPQPAAG